MKKLRFVVLSVVSLLVLIDSSWGICRAASTTSQNAFLALPGQRIFLKGDSITKGFAFGNYVNPSPLRTIYGIANILLKDNVKHPPRMSHLSWIWQGLNPDGSPKTVDSLAGEIQVNIRDGELRPGDWMVYEDAGGLDNFVHPAPNPNSKDMYRRYREALREMVLEAQGTIGRDHIRFMTMFDYQPKVPWSAWDAPLDDGAHTGNDAIRDEAAALGVRVIDMNRIMDRTEEYIEAEQWGRLVGSDGIHPNVYGNFVMALAVLQSLEFDIEHCKLDGLYAHLRHPKMGGDAETIWGFARNPNDVERINILEKLRTIVVQETSRAPAGSAETEETTERSPKFYPTAHTFRRLRLHGRILDHPATQPAGTDKPVSYEIGKFFQLDKETALLVTSMREQGGHDFEIGNDAFIFKNLSDIAPASAIPINRLDSNYVTRAGKNATLAKYAVNGIIVPLGAKLKDGAPIPQRARDFCFQQPYRSRRTDPK